MKPEQLRPSAELAHMGSWIRTGNTELKVHLLFFPPFLIPPFCSSSSFFPSPPPFLVCSELSIPPTVKLTYQRRQGNRKNVHSSKQCIGVACVLCIRVLPSTQISHGILPGSHCSNHVCIDVSFLEPACWVA